MLRPPEMATRRSATSSLGWVRCGMAKIRAKCEVLWSRICTPASISVLATAGASLKTGAATSTKMRTLTLCAALHASALIRRLA